MKKIITILSAAFAALLLLFTLASCGKENETAATVITFDGNAAHISGGGATVNGADVLIRSGGSYTVRGTTSDGRIVVDAEGAYVTLVLDGAQIASSKSGAICVRSAKQTTVSAKECRQNMLTDTGASEADEDANACLYAKTDLILSGKGMLTVNGSKKGIKADADVTIGSGIYMFDCANDAVHAGKNIIIRGGKLTATCGDDAIHAQDRVTIDGGNIDLTAHEGIEGTRITVNGGKVFIRASDDGVNAAHKTKGVTPTVEINGGELEIEMEPGDTDGIDANGDIFISGGTVRVTAQNPFDFDGKGVVNGGTVYVNGKQVTQLTDLSGGEG